jgi:hypothetical protein
MLYPLSFGIKYYIVDEYLIDIEATQPYLISLHSCKNPRLDISPKVNLIARSLDLVKIEDLSMVGIRKFIPS